MSIPKITKTVVSFVVLHRVEDDPRNLSMAEILEECDTGDMIRGSMTFAGGEAVIPTHEVLQAELIEIGNDGTFFDDV